MNYTIMMVDTPRRWYLQKDAIMSKGMMAKIPYTRTMQDWQELQF
jgi:hypothetical protein